MVKLVIARILDALFIVPAAFWISKLTYGRDHIRVIHYHGTPEQDRECLEKHLEFYSKHYDDVNYEEFDNFFSKKIWNKKRPGLIISFDDGLKSNFDVAHKLLKQYGFTGWYCIPTDFISEQADSQEQFARTNRIGVEMSGGRVAMSWAEVRLLARECVIVSHTRSHHRMSDADGPKLLDREILQSKSILEAKCANTIDVFCWVGGEEATYTQEAALKIKKSRYKYAFMTCNYPFFKSTDPYQIQRVHVDSSDSLSLVKLYLSGLYDLYYGPKRRRVVRITA